MRDPVVWVCVVVMAGLVLVDGLSKGQAGVSISLFGVLILGVDANLTYGAGLALVAAAVASSHVWRLRSVLHARGVALSDCLLLACLAGICAGLIVRTAAVVSGAVAGLIQAAVQAGHLTVTPQGTGPVHEVLSGQARVLIFYTLIGAFGALMAAAVQSLITSILVSTGLVALYFPVVGGLAEQAPALLDVHPWLPFGALRGLISGNGAIFGTGGSQVRIISTGRAGLVALAWAAGLCLFVLWRCRGMHAGRGLRPHVGLSLLAATAAAVGIGWGLPTLVDGRVPWQWSAEWREAEDEHRSTLQLAERWALASDDMSLYAEPDVARTIDKVGLVDVPGYEVDVPAASQLGGPLLVPVTVTYEEPLRTGNIDIHSTQYLLTFRVVGGRYEIEAVAGPSIAEAEVDRP